MQGMTEGDRDYFADLVRQKSSMSPADIQSAIRATCETISDCMNLYDNPLGSIDKFCQGWIHREIREADREIMERTGESEVAYRARQYAACFMSMLAMQFKD